MVSAAADERPGAGERPGPIGRLALRLHAGLDRLAAQAPEALGPGLKAGRLSRLTQECAAALAKVAAP